MMFNDMMHGGPTEKEIKRIKDEYKKVAGKKYTIKEFYASLGGEISQNAITYDYQNTCAARLSQALNESGVLKIPRMRGKYNTYRGGDGNYYL